MKAVLISIQPKWCELIANGKKTVEVRKSKPKLETPFKVYIYETKGRLQRFSSIGYEHEGKGKVIGEFVCECVTSLKADNIVQAYYNNTCATCLTDGEIMKYANSGKLYYWHISDLVIYDEPIELWEFRKPTNQDGERANCMHCYIFEETYGSCLECGCDSITRPPQSWCYVEELG